jgi:hypothetical protein
MPIFDHLMLVILGSQGTGKSTLIRELLEPVCELIAPADFKQITDDRNIDLWKNFVIFLDEMGWASKSDVDTVKNIITAPVLQRRPMRTNATCTVAQNATFIGAANATELGELIRDTSGTRRFATVTMSDNPDRNVINAIDWWDVWQSVDHAAEDPMAPFKGVLKDRQDIDRLKHPIEEWITSLDRKSLGGALTHDGRLFTASELHSEFREYEEVRFPGPFKTSIQAFSRRLSALARQSNARFVSNGKKHNQAVYAWCGVWPSSEAEASDTNKVIHLSMKKD